MKNIIAALMLIFSIQAQAILEVDELTEMANQDQSALIEAVAQIRGNLSDLTNREIFEAYFALLPLFEEKAQEYSLQLINPDLVSGLGARMVAHGNRWLKIGEDSTETILSYQRWAELSAAQRFQYQSTEQIKLLETAEEYRLASRNLIALVDYTADKFPGEIYISNGYKEAVSELSVEALKNTTDPEDVLFWLDGLKTQTSVLDYLTYANNEILSQSSSLEPSTWLNTLLSLGNNNLRDNNEFSESIMTFYNDVLIEAFMNSLSDNSEYTSERSSEFFTLLSFSKLGSFVERWVNPITEIPSEDFEDYYNISVQAFAHLRDEGLGRNAAIVSRYISSRMSAEISVLNGYEGTYEFFDDRGTKWFFTFLKDSYQRTIAAIANEQRTVLINYYFVQYDFENNSYVGSEYEPDDSSYQSNTITFSFDDDGSATINMPFVGLNKKATKIQSYPNIFQRRNLDAVPIFGRYRGNVNLPNGSSRAMELNIVQFSESIMARMSGANGHVQLSFKTATDGRDGIIYMTGMGPSNGSWMHIRLEQDEENDQLNGFVIIGGWGMSTNQTTFTKVYE